MLEATLWPQQWVLLKSLFEEPFVKVKRASLTGDLIEVKAHGGSVLYLIFDICFQNEKSVCFHHFESALKLHLL